MGWKQRPTPQQIWWGHCVWSRAGLAAGLPRAGAVEVGGVRHGCRCWPGRVAGVLIAPKRVSRSCRRDDLSGRCTVPWRPCRTFFLQLKANRRSFGPDCLGRQSRPGPPAAGYCALGLGGSIPAWQRRGVGRERDVLGGVGFVCLRRHGVKAGVKDVQ